MKNIINRIKDKFYKQKNVILVSIDTLRYDCVGYQKNKEELIKYDVLKFLETPNLDNIAKKSVCFTNAISVSTYTTSSHASILTGLYPPKHGVRAFYDTKLSKNVSSLAEIFRKEGYITVFSTDIMELFEPLDLTRGFSHIFTKQDRELYEFLDENKDKKIFLFVHFFDVHDPYMFSDYEMYQGYNSDYYDMINFLCDKYNIELDIPKDKPYEHWNYVVHKIEKNMDTFLPFYIKGVTKFDKGRFKEFMNYINKEYIDSSMLIILSDHGEGKSSEENRNLFAHAGFPYENVIRVPLMIYYKGIDTRVVEDQVSIVDIFPTVLEKALNKKLGDIISYDIDGNNLLSDLCECSHKYVLGEIWGCNFYFHPTDQGFLTPGKNIDWRLDYRFVRSKDKKYVICGMRNKLYDESIFNLNNDEFVRYIYRQILGRMEDNEGFENCLKNLNSNSSTKEDLLNNFLGSKEYRDKNKIIMFDIGTDEEELNHINLLQSIIHIAESSKYIDSILDIEKMSIKSEKIFSDNKDEEKIKERLKTLGYLG